MGFTIGDRSSIQRHLNLSPTELSTHSLLSKNLAYLEGLDNEEGTSKVSEVQNLIFQLDTLESELDNARAQTPIGVEMFRVDGQYQVKFKGDVKNGGLEGKVQQYNKYLVELKREVMFEFDTYYLDNIGALIV